MRRLRLSLLAASVVLASSASAFAFAADAPTVIPAAAVHTAEQLRDKAMHDDTAYRIVEGLTTEIGPRLAGGPNDQRARDWVVAKMKALGFDKVYTEPVSYPLWERRSESGEIVAPFPQKLVLTALGYSPATPKGGLTAQVVAFPTLDALKAEIKKRKNTLPEAWRTQLLKPSLEALAVEVQGAVRNFLSSSSIGRVDEILLSGGHASLVGVQAAIEQQTEITTTLANPFANMMTAGKVNERYLQRDLPAYIVSAGLALRGLQ